MTPSIPAWFEANHPGYTVAELVRLVTAEDRISVEASDAVSELGEAALPAVLETLDDPDPSAQEAACYALGALAEGDRDWLDERAAGLHERLLPYLASPHDRVRRAACGAAGHLGRVSPATTEALRRNLAIEREEVWRAAAFALARLGVWSRDVSDALHRVMRAPDWVSRWSAAQVLADREPCTAVEATLRALLAEPMNEIWLLECRRLMARHGWLRPGDDRPAPFPAGGGVVRWLGGR
jgi:HEAT repeat protein